MQSRDCDLHVGGSTRLEHVKSYEKRVHNYFKPAEDEPQKSDRKREKQPKEEPIKRRKKKEIRDIKSEVTHIKEEV
ncbi:hypothetical protein FOPE_10803 [Fonsecaea pedrosoi]|nr:hypothetical protein FOPE_10803 [Fonsecaea pedrosoi]